MLKPQEKWYVLVKKRYLRAAKKWLSKKQTACYCLARTPVEDCELDSYEEAFAVARKVAESCKREDENDIKFNLSIQRILVEQQAFPASRYKNGQRLKFTYPDYGEPTGYPEYKAHSGQEVTVVRELTYERSHPEIDEELAPVYLIRAADGWEGHVHEDELKPIRPKKK